MRGGERGGCRDGALTEDRNTTASDYDSLTSKKRCAPMLLGLRHRTPGVVGVTGVNEQSNVTVAFSFCLMLLNVCLPGGWMERWTYW